MLACPDGSLQVGWPESRRRGQEHEVAVLDNAFKSVETHEAPFGGNIDSAAEVVIIHEALQTRGDAVLESIPHRYQANVLAGAEALPRGTGTAIAAADQTDADDVRPLGMNVAGQAPIGHHRRGADDGRRLQKLSTGRYSCQYPPEAVGKVLFGFLYPSK